MVKNFLVDDLHVVVEGVYIWYTCCDVGLEDFFRTELVEIHQYASEAISMSRYYYILPFFYFWQDLFFEVGNGTHTGVFEAFSSWRCDIEASSPDVNLLFSEFFSNIVFIMSLKISIMTLIEGLVVGEWNIALTKVFKDDFEGVRSTAEFRGVGFIKNKLFEFYGSFVGFFFSFV